MYFCPKKYSNTLFMSVCMYDYHIAVAFDHWLRLYVCMKNTYIKTQTNDDGVRGEVVCCCCCNGDLLSSARPVDNTPGTDPLTDVP